MGVLDSIRSAATSVGNYFRELGDAGQLRNLGERPAIGHLRGEDNFHVVNRPSLINMGCSIDSNDVIHCPTNSSARRFGSAQQYSSSPADSTPTKQIAEAPSSQSEAELPQCGL